MTNNMKVLKISTAIALTVMIVASCGDNSPYVKRSELEQSENEKAELKMSLEELQGSFEKQNEDLSRILNDLSVISRKTAHIQLNVEGVPQEVDQVELISSDIEAVKKRIDDLEKEAARARKLDKKLAIATETINELRETISIQESRIAELNEKISSQDATILAQKNTISAKDSKIASQADELRITIALQVEMIYQAGVALEDIADNGDFKITGRKNKTSVKEYRKSIYNRAVEYYKTALSEGHEMAQSRLDGVREKIEALENEK